MNKQEIDSLIQDLLDGNIAPLQLAALEAELRTNNHACARYAELVHIHNALQLRSSACQQIPNNVVPMDQVILKQKRKSFKIAALAAAAVILVTFLSMQLIFVRVAPHAPALSFTTSPATQFTITHSDSEKSHSQQTLEVGSRLELRQGSLELNFGTGVKSVIIAPADITLQDANTLAMTEGRGWFQVPQQAVGFRVLTKQLDIVDLGTEFGILSGSDVADEVHVFKGAVTAAATDGDGSFIHLHADEALRISPSGSLEPITATPNKFLEDLPQSLPHIRWTFDGDTPFQATGSHPDAAHIQTIAHGSPALVKGRSGNAIKLNGVDQYLESDWSGFSGLRPRTVSAWVKIRSKDSFDNNSALVGWGNRNSRFGKWTLNFSQPKDPGRLRLSLGNTWVSNSQLVPHNRWVHLAIATDGIVKNDHFFVDLYLDGQRETYQVKRPLDDASGTQISERGSVPLLIGTSLHRIQHNRALLKAKIDEITIYDGYLTPEQVEQLAQP